MISFLLKLKSFYLLALFLLALAAVLYGGYWHSQYNNLLAQNIKLNEQLASCNVNQELLQSSIKHWKAEAAEYDKKLKHKEALIAKQNKLSDKKVYKHLHAQYSPNCEKAIQEAIQNLEMT